MTNQDDKLDRFLKAHKPVPRAPRAGESDRLWAAVEALGAGPLPRGARPPFRGGWVPYVVPGAALLLVLLVLLSVPFFPRDTEESIANAKDLSESMTLSFVDEEEGWDEVDVLMASLDE